MEDGSLASDHSEVENQASDNATSTEHGSREHESNMRYVLRRLGEVISNGR